MPHNLAEAPPRVMLLRWLLLVGMKVNVMPGIQASHQRRSGKSPTERTTGIYELIWINAADGEVV